jgi:hypothetical protein
MEITGTIMLSTVLLFNYLLIFIIYLFVFSVIYLYLDLDLLSQSFFVFMSAYCFCRVEALGDDLYNTVLDFFSFANN